MVDPEQDRLLPIANVGRIMKQILPPTAKISKEGKQTMQECATEFISFVTGEASDKCHKENRKTINGDDICWALSALGFDNYAEVIVRYLHKYRESERDKANQMSKGNNNIGPPHPTTTNTTTRSDQDKVIGDSDHDIHARSTSTTTPTLMEFKIIEKGDHITLL
ncbi:Nuclear transcription factor Y subunit B [Parasponia andersonii]|uniref:Nuclear transcription factor Y subunit B n=1 Tax=Parasponia andersonii TaxID=3476 RepID=A0A2P5AJ54_PARAD|nr:Nuclear transcription factor Y subunit B [Parasponia andersonii]